MRKEQIVSESKEQNPFGDITVEKTYMDGRKTKETTYPDGVVVKEVDVLGNGDWTKEIRWPNGHVQDFRLFRAPEPKVAPACPSPNGMAQARFQPSPEPVELVVAASFLVGQYKTLVLDLQNALQQLEVLKKKLMSTIRENKAGVGRSTSALKYVDLCYGFLITSKDFFSLSVSSDRLAEIMKTWLGFYNDFCANYLSEKYYERQKKLLELYPKLAELIQKIEDLFDTAAAAAQILSTEKSPLRPENKLGLFCRQLEITPPVFISVRDFAG